MFKTIWDLVFSGDGISISNNFCQVKFAEFFPLPADISLSSNNHIVLVPCVAFVLQLTYSTILLNINE